MKQLAFISGGLSSSLIILGSLFKVQHWPGAGIILVVGLCIFSILFIPSMTRYLYVKTK